MITFKQFKQKLMTDLKQRIIKNYAYDKKANDDIHYHLNFGAKQINSKTSKHNMLLNMIIQLSEQVQIMNQQMVDGFNALNKRMDCLESRMNQLENKVDEGFQRIDARLDQLENQAITHGWNIKKI